MARNVEDSVDMGTLRAYLDPYILPSLLGRGERKRIDSIRRHLAETGSTCLLAEETRTGLPHRFTLADLGGQS